MGDRTWWNEKCPKCSKEIEVYDAPSCMQWSKHCDHCNWDDGLNYYEIEPNTIGLLSDEEAKNRGFIS